MCCRHWGESEDHIGVQLRLCLTVVHRTANNNILSQDESEPYTDRNVPSARTRHRLVHCNKATSTQSRVLSPLL